MSSLGDFLYHVQPGINAATCVAVLNRHSLAGDGGALWVDDSNAAVSLRFSTFASNTAQSGGAVFLRVPGLIQHCKFSNNTAASGGAIYVNSGAKDLIMVNNCLFYNNVALGGTARGGALLIKDTSLKLSKSLLSGNTADRGSALAQSGTFTMVFVMGCIFVQNKVKQNGIYVAGAVIIENSSNFIMQNSIIHKNDRTGLVLKMTKADISSSSFISNTNGAITTSGFSSLLLITNSSFIRSRMSFSSMLQLENTKIFIQKCTFVENKAHILSHTLQISVQNNVDLRLYGCTFMEPNFLSYNKYRSIVYLDARENKFTKVATMYVLDTSIHHGPTKTLSPGRNMFLDTAKVVAVHNVNCTKKSSVFASGMCGYRETNKR